MGNGSIRQTVRTLRRSARSLKNCAGDRRLSAAAADLLLLASCSADGAARRMERKEDSFGLSLLTTIGNGVRELLAVAAVCNRVRASSAKVGALLEISQTCLDQANRLLIARPALLFADYAADTWQSTRRGAFFRRHDLGVELLVEAVPGDTRWSGSIAGVTVALADDEDQAKRDVEVLVEAWFESAIEHRRQIEEMLAA